MTRALLVTAALLLAACRNDMADQPKKRPDGVSPLFADRNASRPRVDGTFARNEPATDELLEDGTIGGAEADVTPSAITLDTVRRGRERFDVYCSPCHGVLGDARGMVVRRGFPSPPSFHDPRLRAAPIGHFVHVINRGFGTMYSYGDRVEPADRWAIAAYIRALQLSQNAPAGAAPQPAGRTAP